MFRDSGFTGNISRWKFNSKAKLKNIGLSDKVLKHIERRKRLGRFADIVM